MTLLNPRISSTQYLFSDLNEFLLPITDQTQGACIGEYGENLTISFLSLNRINLSIKLLDSIDSCIEDFRGEVLIIDNGTADEDYYQLLTRSASMKAKTRVIRLDKNYGVAGGRNRAMEYVQTDWVLFLDNDIFFISNPIPQLNSELSMLGCHFMNLPLLDHDGETLFAFGGHLYVDIFEGHVSVGGGTAYQQTNSSVVTQQVTTPFFSNFLFGGASLLRRDTFLKLGGFDENMFVGFEDTDLSIRLFREGYKVGNSAAVALVHDHPKPSSSADLEYEKRRFASDVIRDSALYLENKYGYKIWGPNLINWLKEKNESFGVKVPDGLHEISPNEDQRPKIALITDVDYWAFGNIARQIKKHLSDEFNFVLLSLEHCDWNPFRLIMGANECKVLHFFWRENISLLNEANYVHTYGPLPTSFHEFKSTYLSGKIFSTCVYDHLFLEEDEISVRNHIFTEFNYYVCSNKLRSIYDGIPAYRKPLMVIEDGVDEELFYPLNLDRFDDLERPLVVGWVGNSKWGGEIEDFKGFRTFIDPIVRQLRDEGIQVDGNYCDRNVRMVPHQDMVKYYADIDVLVCMSKIEGTPNPVLEAMSCGVPVISTDVGIVHDVLGPRQQRFILTQRNAECLRQALLEVYENRYLLRELSEENLRYIESWRWTKQSGKFRQYFSRMLEA